MSFRPVNDRSSQPGLGDNNKSSVSNASPLNITAVSAAQYHASVLTSQPLPNQPSPTSDSQATAQSSNNSTESNRVFTPTPPIIERAGSTEAGSSGQASSQESQLLQLSQLAAAREKMPAVGSRTSVKRTAEDAFKGSRTSPPDSPPRPSSHSRNVSGVSAASTTSSRITELSSDLKTRLSYAMLKVQNGWQSRTIDEVETLTSRAASPASSNSTAIAARTQSSTSPKIVNLQHSTPPTSQAHLVSSRPADGTARGPSASPGLHSPSAQSQGSPNLAPPVSIQPHRNDAHPRRTSDPKFAPSFLAPRSHQTSPQTPAASSLHITPNHRNLRAVAEVTSPTHSKSEKEAMEALLFMSSPGNSANMKMYQPSSQPLSNLRNGGTSVPTAQRKALPTSAPKRKGLPNGRPAHSSQPLPATHSPRKRVGFERTHTDPGDMMDLDTPPGAGRNTAPHARVANGTWPRARGGRFPPGPFSDTRTAHRRPGINVEDLDKVLDGMADEASSSDSEGEIVLPVRRGAHLM